MIKGYAAEQAGGELKPFEYDPGELRPGQVEIAVETCGICHSDLSMLDNEWGMSAYPFMPGHEVSGRIAAIGEGVSHLTVGQRVGLGWYTHSCMTCHQCMSGDHNLCSSAEQTIVGRHGGFADKVRCHAEWALPIPEGVDPKKAGPLFCGGITVFNPIIQMGVLPTSRVGVVGIGGLGHMALRFLNAWGCEVVAFTSSESKMEEAKRLGAHRCVRSRSEEAIAAENGSLDFILVTANATLPWDAYIAALAPRGRLHIVGAVLEPIPTHVFPLLIGQKSLSASPLGSPANTAKMLDFCSRHGIAPDCEFFPMSKVNDAMEHLKSGKARYRIVLENDF
ncbi:MAG: NAD(P)-dependent alcohol dehydrogenase [Phycisphaeraceae bacterium]|nr:MAG: NAD(P)-dependent alcohol dehydrogenase [Phycisphaeraceae bacterium]